MDASTVISWNSDDQGIVTLTFDSTPGPMVGAEFFAELERVVAQMEASLDQITGVVVTAEGSRFIGDEAAPDLIRQLGAEPRQCFDVLRRRTAVLRRLERLGKPVAVAIESPASGTGLAVALGGHHLVVLDRPGVTLSLPAVRHGLLPTYGSLVRTVHRVGVLPSLEKLLLAGQTLAAGDAHALGLIDEIVHDDARAAARAWVLAQTGDAHARWDVRGFTLPGGSVASPQVAGITPVLPANLRARTKGAPAAAARAALAAVFEVAQVTFDKALEIEDRQATALLTGREARNIIKVLDIEIPRLRAGECADEVTTFSRVGVVGAGMMGAGIAYDCARHGFDVVLKDIDLESATRGKETARKMLDRAERGKPRDTQDAAAILDRIVPTGDIADLGGCDVVIEAVFEDIDLKRQVFADLEKVITEGALLASNTSTLPITSLARDLIAQQDFIGLHFFSPVDRMPLVEIIPGSSTSEDTLARALGFVRQIRKVPVVVGDKQGFFTSRIISRRVREAFAMLAEGVAPASIERAGDEAGYLTPPLKLSDEVSLPLLQRERNEARASVEREGREWSPRPGDEVIDRMVDDLARHGRAAGSGFYDYEAGRTRGLWSGLASAFDSSPDRHPFEDIRDRLLFTEAVGAAECVAEGLLRSTTEADVASVLGIGFPAWSGGVLHFIDDYDGGVDGFVSRADELADRYGEHLRPPSLLRRVSSVGAALMATDG